MPDSFTDEEPDSGEDEYGNIRLLAEGIGAISLEANPGRDFLGKSSVSAVFRTAEARPVAHSDEPAYALPLMPRRRIFWTANPV